MTDDSTNRSGESGVGAPQAIVRMRARPSVVWLIPLVAAAVGLYLAYWAWSEQGPTISIVFESAEGLEAGKTKLKFKEVDVGVVETVELTDDLAKVRVTATLVNGLSRYLTGSTRFWVVRAEVSAGQISGLDTFLSGVYIAVDPSREGARTTDFIGLEKAPVVTSDKPGTLFELRAHELSSIEVGSPVYYRWLRVGQVAGYSLDEAGESVSVQVFIDAPHDHRVRSTTRFWNASGIDAVVSAEGIQIDSPSLISILVGGIAFETPATVTVARDVPENMIFELYPNKQATRRLRYSLKERYLLYFDGSVSGLVRGSPVEFRGIKLGEVLDVDLELDRETSALRIPVVIEIEPERLGLTGRAEAGDQASRLREFVARGFRARLASGNILTGQKAINFDFIQDAKPAEIDFSRVYPVLPTSTGGLEAITERVARIVGKVDHLPIESIGKNLDEVLLSLSATLKSLQSLAGVASSDLVPNLATSLEKLEDTLISADAMIAPESVIAQDLEELMRDLSIAARSLRMLAERLEEHPEELLRGKNE
ncbi:MAG: MCE family protein [bacterium]|nr:mammalian cell entry protein [Deltaproteobacteria bacterium]MCP4906959.1 MCE family protein [bacterium]